MTSTDKSAGWDYRVVSEFNKTTGRRDYSIIECYYDNKEQIKSYCSAKPLGESLELLKKDLEKMLQATQKEVLIARRLP